MFVVKKLISGGTLTALILASSALFAGPPDDRTQLNVNVVNEPGVNVINDATSPIPVEIQNGAQTIVEWRYVGLTTHEDTGAWTFDGIVGVAAMNKACASDYGLGARAANISESYFRTDPLADTRDAWVAPGDTIQVLEFIDGNGDITFIPVDGITGAVVGARPEFPANAAIEAYCVRYITQSDTVRAPISRADSRIFWRTCDYTLPAACSAPVAIPVTP